jgi:hypothetical protein
MKTRKQSLKEYAVILAGTDVNGETDVETLYLQALTAEEAETHGLMQTELIDATIIDCVVTSKKQPLEIGKFYYTDKSEKVKGGKKYKLYAIHPNRKVAYLSFNGKDDGEDGGIITSVSKIKRLNKDNEK